MQNNKKELKVKEIEKEIIMNIAILAERNKTP